MMAKKTTINKMPVIGALGDRLAEVLKQYSRVNRQNLIYDSHGKTLDPTKLMPPKELKRYLETVSSAGITGKASIFDRFFEIGMGRAGRYSEYEQINQRIPEAARALQLYVDSIMAPNLSSNENQLVYTKLKSANLADEAMSVLKAIIEKTKFEDILPQIAYTSFLYGDCFLEMDSTSNGVRYILHSPKNCTMVHDKQTDIELGVLIQTDNTRSQLLEMLSYAYPNLRINMPQETVAVISDRVYMADNSNRKEVTQIEDQIKELLGDILRDYGAKYRYLSPNKYIRFSSFYNNMYYPYGSGILDPSRSIAKQLLLVESALSIYRATRTPLRTLWTVEVGNTPEDQIAGIVNGIMNRVRRQKIVDMDENGSSSIDSIPEIMSVEEDIFTPSVNGSALIKAEPIPSGDITSFIEDADYFRKKLLSALGIPPSYLAEESGGSTRALLTLEDINFSRTIKKYQIDFNHGLEDFANTCFLLINKPQYINAIKLTLPVPKTIEDNLRVENIDNRLNTVSNFISNFPNIPKLWILKNIGGFSDEDINEMNAAKREQEKLTLFSEQYAEENNSAMNDDFGGGGPSFGGSPNFGTNDGLSEDFNEDLNSTEEFGNEFTEDTSMSSPLGEINTDSNFSSEDLGLDTEIV